MSKPEAKVEAHLVRRVKGLGGEERKCVWPGRRGANDRFIALGVVGLLELKAPGKKPKGHQTREHDRLRKQGVIIGWADSIEGVDKFLDYMLAVARHSLPVVRQIPADAYGYLKPEIPRYLNIEV